MSIPQLNNPKKLSYSELRTQVSELARRMNILTEMRAVPVEYTAAAKFTFSDSGATLDVPRLDELIEELEEAQEALEECEAALEECEADKLVCDAALEECAAAREECETALEECAAALAEAEVKIDCLEDIITPETVNGVGAWDHAVETSVTSPAPGCSYIATSSISVKFVEMDGANPKLQFYRTNGDSDCQANGTINWPISLNFDGSSSLPIPWSGAKGATSSIDRTISPGTYYVYAYGLNLVDNAGQQELQAKGSFTLSGTGEIVRTITTSVTTTEGDAAPCA